MIADVVAERNIMPITERINLPGDKSISHRALIFSAISNCNVNIYNLSTSDDVNSTLNALKELSVPIKSMRNNYCKVSGVGLYGLKKPSSSLYLGNSGTSMRLLPGILVGQNFSVTLVGDESLNKRPMHRIIAPLLKMGANISSANNNAPLCITGSRNLRAINYDIPIASAQVYGCLHLAQLYTGQKNHITVSPKIRNHTDRISSFFDEKAGISASDIKKELDFNVPGDISSAAFFIVASVLLPGSSLTIYEVGLNPSRIAFINILRMMGARISYEVNGVQSNEESGTIESHYSRLHGISVPVDLVVGAIDEFPALFIAFALAEGKTILTGASELKHKESDRLESMANGLAVLGVKVKLLEDGIIIEGVDKFKGGIVKSCKDHRVAMAFLIASAFSDDPITVLEGDCVSSSFPEFFHYIRKLGFKVLFS